MMKIKVAFGNDMRLFKYEGASLLEAYDDLTTFVVNTFGAQDFLLQYRDDEDDLITLSSEHELDEAFDVAMERGKTLKVFVVAVAAQQTVEEVAAESAVEEKEEVPPEEADVEATAETEAGGEAENGNHMHDLASLILEDEGFRQEFAAFVQDVVLQVREGDNLETAIETALAAHEELSSHPFVRDHFLAMLPAIAQKGTFAIPFLQTIEPTTIPGMIDQAAQAIRDGHHMMPFLTGMLGGGTGARNGVGGFPFGGCPAGAGANPGAPPMMGPFGGFGGMPFFGGGFGPHGQPHGPPGAGQGFPFGPGFRGGRGRGHGRGRGFGHGPRGGGCQQSGGRAACGKRSKRDYRADIVDPNVTVSDKALVLPNSSVVKTWRIRNTGEEDFPEGTKLKYVGRPFNQLVDGVEFPVEAIPVGEEGEVSILLSTPGAAGRFGSAWRLQLPDGTPFGPMFRARVVVVSEDGVAQGVSDESDDMADIYDTEQAGPSDKKAKKLQKLLAKKAKLEAQSAKLGSRLDNVQSRIEEMSGGSATEAVDSAPIVSTLPTETAGGGANAQDNENEAVVEAEDHADGTFANELAELQNMGFSDLRLNRMLLQQFNGQMEAVLNTLLEMRA